MTTARKPRLSPKQQQLLDAVERGADLRYLGWQQIRVTYGPKHPENYIATQGTLHALLDRGLVETGPFGVRAVTA
jgi:hypothetical protein